MNTIPKHSLSKSTFMYGCQCVKRLWLHKYMPEVREEMDESKEDFFQQGTNVGLLARQLFEGGVDATPATTYQYQESVIKTQEYIKQGIKVIYEAAFQYNGLLCAIDILVKEDDSWVAYEVKSSTKVKETHVLDASFQYYVMQNSGIKITDFNITHLNNKYIRRGDLSLTELYTHQSIFKEVNDNQPFIQSKEKELKELLLLNDLPKIDIGKHCYKPYECDFIGFCTKDIETEPVNYGEPYINKEVITDFLKQLIYPIYFMDFETWSTPLPLYDTHWPYRQNCFQYSIHKQNEANGVTEHFEYLAEGIHSVSLAFLEKLIDDLGSIGTILVYNITFEKTRLNELCKEHPEFKDKIESISARMIDLMKPFRKNYRLPEMEGSYSIKYVLPALVPELSYRALEIGNGLEASKIFFELNQESDETKIQNTRIALLEYCKMDTYGMVKILEKMYEVL